MSDEEYDNYVKMGLISEDPLEGLDQFEAFDHVYEKMIESAKNSMKNIINKSLKDV